MSWFFANPTSFQNGSSETITNNPINLGLLSSSPTKVSHTPIGTSESLFAILFVFDGAAADQYLHYPNQAARDADFVLVELSISAIDPTRAGWFTATPSSFNNANGEPINNKDINLDVNSSFAATTSKPIGTSLSLPSICFDVTDKNSTQFLYYPDIATRDADLVLINTATGSVGVPPTLITDHSGLNLDDGTNPHGTTAADVGAEPAFVKKSAFNKNFGTGGADIPQGNHTHTRISTATTSDVTPMILESSESVANNSVKSFISIVTGVEASTGDVYVFKFTGTVKNIEGTTTLVGSVLPQSIAEDAGTATWGGVVITANNTTNSIDITATGETDHIIKWVAETMFYEVTF